MQFTSIYLASLKRRSKNVFFPLLGGFLFWLLLLPGSWGQYSRLAERLFIPSSSPLTSNLRSSSLSSAVDPAFAFSTFHGGTGAEQGTALAVDMAGNVFLTGYTTSTNLPIYQPLQDRTGGGQDAFVLKLSPAGRVIWSTYLGGGGTDSGSAIAVDSDGAVYVAGTTNSIDFPLKSPIPAGPRGSSDAFLVKISSGGDQILHASVFGGSSVEGIRAISIDSSDNVWLTGVTQSVDFPLRNPLQAQPRGRDEGFLVKISGGDELLFSTYLGGSADDRPGSTMVNDRLGNVYIAGSTNSGDFPITAGVVQPIKRNGFDSFITKIRSDGTDLIYSTFLGGSADDGASSIALNSDGEAYVTGGTNSPDFPVTSGVFQPSFAGGGAFGGDAYVARLDSQGKSLFFSTFLGGAGPDQGSSITIDLSGNVYVAGRTSLAGAVGSPPTFPLLRPLQSSYGGGFSDGFLTCINSSGAALVFSTFLGGIDFDTADAVAVDLLHNVYVTGNTLSANFPSVSPTQPSIGSSLSDAFAVKVRNARSPSSLVSVSAASYNGEAIADESIAAGFGTGLALGTQGAETLPLPISIAGTHVVITDSKGKSFSASLFYVSPTQVNFYIPPGVASGPGTISLFTAGDRVAAGNIQVTSLAPGLFAANSNGQGVAAAVALRLRADRSQSYEPVARYDTQQSRFVPLAIDLGEDRGPESDRVFLILFGTGLRHLESLSQVNLKIGGVSANPDFAGAQGYFLGLDQINVLIPRALIGRGETEIELLTDGKAANKVIVSIK
jgi:uncharacterized protein (TIGR03437 family)